MSAEGKTLRAGERPRQRQLDEQVRAALERKACARPFVERRRFAALHEISAHHTDDGSLRFGPHVPEQRGMSVMQRIKFTNYAGNPVFCDHFE